MNRSEKIEVLGGLGEYISSSHPALMDAVAQSGLKNRWFTQSFIRKALDNVTSQYLDKEKLTAWLHAYPESGDGMKRVGLILAGNIPCVGFHDLMSVFLSGNISLIKYSEKDEVLLSYLISVMTELDARVGKYFEKQERLTSFDAVITTGSNNTARYFHYYFGKYPHIIRNNKNGVAVLSGNETKEELRLLGNDIFDYFGLGCRNVSKIYVPQEYDFIPLMEVLDEFDEMALHNKYKNNFDYNLAIYMLNKIKIYSNGCVVLREEKVIPSRIASLHYGFYNDTKELSTHLKAELDGIQCIVSSERIDGVEVIPFGNSQMPSLSDYADGVDTMEFLISLNNKDD